jgi:hypothetical protein
VNDSLRFTFYRANHDNAKVRPIRNHNWPSRKWLVGLGLFVLLIILLDVVISLLSDYIWMDSLGYGQVFITLFSTRILLFGAGFLLFGGTLFMTLLGIRRAFARCYLPDELPFFLRHKKLYVLGSLALSFLYGLIGSSVVQGLGWERLLTYRHQTPFQVADPIFGHDISFYVYSLPFFNFMIHTLISLMVIVLIIQGSAYGISRLFWADRGARMQLMVSVLVFGLLWGARHLLQRYETLFNDTINIFQQKSVVYGAGYTDVMVTIPFSYALAVLSVLASLGIIFGLARGNWRLMVAGPLVYVIVLVVGQGAAWGVQQFIVAPNEFEQEKPYLEHNLTYTRRAYDLNDIRQEAHPGLGTLTADVVEQNRPTLDNVRINDYRPLLDFYNSMETVRTYYQFNDVDVDRYRIDGEYQQVFIGARELNADHLPSQAKTWVNETLRYTHGYGIVASHVNRVSPQGQPEFLVSNFPPVGQPEVTRPQIYFGEQPYAPVIVNTTIDEFDHPEGDSIATYRYTAKTGIPMTRLNRFIYAWEERSPRIIISGYIHEESQLLRKRNIMERLNAIAPFLIYDEDPYLVVRDDGTLVWIVDAYTTTRFYPYSEPAGSGFNYIRNPVKAVVDAYTGEVHFYIVDGDDPLLATYQRIFPDMFSHEIPDDIRAHFRYPVNLFSYQADIFRAYHMTDLEVFYNREDMWAFPTERYYNEDISMEPYYITMQLEEAAGEEFILMQPFTPNNRQNMVAWLAARNDGESYGELILYRFPKQETVYGPQQIENRINQDPYISQQLNLWSQGGSRTIRGNLLVIPIGDTVIYVEPVYIQSNSPNALPEVGKVIVAYQDEIAMEDTFEEALEQVLSLDTREMQEEAEEKPDEKMGTAEALIEQLAQLFEGYREAMADGEWERAGRIMAEIEERLEQWYTRDK